MFLFAIQRLTTSLLIFVSFSRIRQLDERFGHSEAPDSTEAGEQEKDDHDEGKTAELAPVPEDNTEAEAGPS